jgi:hypothetical protein
MTLTAKFRLTLLCQECSRSASQVMVDTHTYFKRHENERYNLQNLAQETAGGFQWVSKPFDTKVEAGEVFKNSNPTFESHPKHSFATRPTAEDQQKNKELVGRNEDDLLLVYPFLKGFSLSTKTWGMSPPFQDGTIVHRAHSDSASVGSFNIDLLSPLEPNASPFQHLVLPPKKKAFIASLVESHRRFGPVTGDVIENKGIEVSILRAFPRINSCPIQGRDSLFS